MGWNRSFVLFPDTGADEMSALGFAPAPALLGMCWGLEGGHVLVEDVDSELAGQGSALAAALGRPVIEIEVHSVSDVYRWAVEGAEGTEREWLFVDGEEVANSGTPLPGEAGIGELTEDTMGDLVRQVWGIELYADRSHAPVARVGQSG